MPTFFFGIIFYIAGFRYLYAPEERIMYILETKWVGSLE